MSQKDSLSPAELDQFLLDPGTAFADPDQVLAHGGLSDSQRIEVLRRWAYDASEESVATEEGMPGGGGDLLARILAALHQLTGGVDVEHVGPTKQHGIPRSTV